MAVFVDVDPLSPFILQDRNVTLDSADAPNQYTLEDRNRINLTVVQGSVTVRFRDDEGNQVGNEATFVGGDEYQYDFSYKTTIPPTIEIDSNEDGSTYDFLIDRV